jgi:hypothetical protein
MSGNEWARADVTIVMAGGPPAPPEQPQGIVIAAGHREMEGNNAVPPSATPARQQAFLGASGRVAPGDCSPGAPTDPYVQDSRIRFLK